MKPEIRRMNVVLSFAKKSIHRENDPCDLIDFHGGVFGK